MVEVDTFFEPAPVPVAAGLPKEVTIYGLCKCFIDTLKVWPIPSSLWLLPLPPFGADPIVGFGSLPPDPGKVGNDGRDWAFDRSPEDPATGEVGDDEPPGRVPALPEGPTEVGLVVPDP